MDRTDIKNALLSLATGVTFSSSINGFTTWAQPPSRRLKLWGNVDPTKQPACFLVQHREEYQHKGVGRLIDRYLDMGFWCYAPTGDPAADVPLIGDDMLDIMIEALETVLVPDDPTRDELTLGGLCHWARIMRQDNMFIRDPGDIDSQALLVLPIRVLLP